MIMPLPCKLPTIAVILLLAACGGTDDSADGGSSDLAGGASLTLNTGYKLASWAPGVTVTYGDCTLRYQSDGLPNHARDAEYALPNMGVMVPSSSTAHAGADPTKSQSYDVTFATCPSVQAVSTKTSLGGIGYMISGADLFNPYEGDGTTIALASNFSVKGTSGNDVYFVDSCNGHPTPMGQYHYHGLPPCVTTTVDTASGPSHIIGIALDGFPIYGNRDASGKEITASQLDECNGTTSPTPEFPAGVYHYVLLDTTDGSSSLGCYKGKPAVAQNTASCGAGLALAKRDPAPFRRALTGVKQSFDDFFRSL